MIKNFQLSYFLVECMNKSKLVLPTWPRFFVYLGCFDKHINSLVVGYMDYAVSSDFLSSDL